MSKRNALMEDSVSLEVVFEDEVNKLKLKSDDDVLAVAELPAGSTVAIGPVVGATVTSGDEVVTIKWSDPANTVVEGVTLAEWGKTVLVRKVGSAPTNPEDGDVLETVTVRNKYASTGYVDTTVTNGVEYHYGIFPATKSNRYNLETVVVGHPEAVYPSAATGLSVQTSQGTAQVSFTTPGDATSVALVYKKDSAPTSSSDGTKISNYVSGTDITGLEDEATYYFVVYTYNAKGRETASTAISGVIKATVELPSTSGTLVYSGSSQSPTWDNYDPTKLTLGGTTSGTDAGTYTATFTPKGNYVWEDGTNVSKDVTWTIERAPISTVPTQANADTLRYTGSSLSPTWSNYNATELTLSGTTSGINAGSYDAQFTPTANYKWSDASGTSAKTVSWTIKNAVISAVPTQNGTITYDGTVKTPSWNNYDSNKLTIGGTTSATNANTYTATFTPKTNYEWSDGSTSAKDASWSITKAAGAFTLSKNSTEINISSAPTDTVTVTTASNGVIDVSVSPSDNSIATVSVNNDTKVITITGVAAGNATVTVSMAAGTNYTAPTSQTIAVTVKTVELVDFSTATPDQIGAMIDAAYDGDVDLSAYWNEGDEMTVQLSAITAVSNQNIAHAAQKMVLTVLGFNHDTLKTAVNGKTKAAVTLGFKFIMGNNGTGEWEYYWGSSHYPVGDSENYSGSPLRNFLNGPLKNALPAAIRSKIKTVLKPNFTTHTNGSTATVNTEDDLFLLSYPEVFGTTTYGNYKGGNAVGSYEGTQYPYFATSSNRIKYVNNNGAASSANYHWWLRSPSSGYDSAYGYYWCIVGSSGSANHHYGDYQRGVVAAFCC